MNGTVQKILGIYRGKKKIGVEILHGRGTVHLSPFKDLLLLHTGVLKACNEGDGLLLFLNVNTTTLLKKGCEVSQILKESMNYLPVLEVNIEDVIPHLDEFKKVKDQALLLSFDHVKLTPKHLDVIKATVPTYIKMPLEEFGGLGREGISAIRDMIQETTQSTLIISHVENVEDFIRLPKDALWMGFYERALKKG
ncbi:hypothetical protein [Hydrogenivirga sp.]